MHQSLAYERWHKRPCKCGTGQRRGCSEHFLYLYYWVAVHPAKRDAQPEFRHIEIASRCSSSHMGVSLNGGTPKTPQMLIILGRKAHGCWGFPTVGAFPTILGNPHMVPNQITFCFIGFGHFGGPQLSASWSWALEKPVRVMGERYPFYDLLFNLIADMEW